MVVRALHRDKAEFGTRWQKIAQEDGGTVTLEEYTKARFTCESEVMRTLKHDHVVRLIHCRVEGTTFDTIITKFYMEELDCDLTSFIFNNLGTITRAEIAEMARQICLALVYLHGQGPIHSDLKPKNILIDKANNILKLADFVSAMKLEIGE